MNDRDEIELSEAFRDLTAPRSTANYANRAPAAERYDGGRRWPQALASVVAVLVALGGAGTFLALRNARQSGVATMSAGNPPARSGAAMAWDSTAGVTVMFGGSGAAGNTQLHDTWVWDGSSWGASAHPGGPGAMVDVHMSDDPADGGVLLTGMPALKFANGSGVVGGGCVTGVTGTGSPNAAAGAPGVATGAPPAGHSAAPPVPVGSSPPATAAPSGTKGVPPPVHSAAPPAPVVSPCPSNVPPYVPPSVQTWIFNSQGWHRVAASAKAVVPSVGAQLAYDPASGQVLAVAAMFYPCGPLPLGSGGLKQPQIACELPASNSSSSTSGSGGSASSGSAAAPQVCTVNQCPVRPAPCPLAASATIYSCGGGGSISTWVWSGGHWSTRSTTGPVNATTVVPLSGTASRRATLAVETWTPNAACQGPTAACASLPAPTKPAFDTWVWTGSGWTAASSTSNGVFPLSGSAVTSVDDTVIAVDGDGSTRTLDLASMRSARAGSVTPRWGEAVSQGPSGTVVLFGGFAITTIKSAAVVSSANRPGSDTWTWNGHAWRHVAGTVPVVPPAPSVCPATGGNLKGCVMPPGLPSILPAPAGSANAVPGSTGLPPSPSPTS